jgi:hypothetical protein
VVLFLFDSRSYHHLHFFTQTLTTLDLYWNEIGDEGAQHLVDALQNNTVILFVFSSLSYHRLHFSTQILTTLNLFTGRMRKDLAGRIEEFNQRKKNKSEEKH